MVWFSSVWLVVSFYASCLFRSTLAGMSCAQCQDLTLADIGGAQDSENACSTGRCTPGRFFWAGIFVAQPISTSPFSYECRAVFLVKLFWYRMSRRLLRRFEGASFLKTISQTSPFPGFPASHSRPFPTFAKLRPTIPSCTHNICLFPEHA